MSKSELHNWECAIENICGKNTDKMLAIAQDIYNTAFVRGKNMLLEEQQTKWTPVSEGLPKKQDRYLVTIKWKGSYSGDVYTETDTAVYMEKLKEWDHDGVIAWKPLPKPYKGESQ